MHKYMRAVGFSDYADRSKQKALLQEIVLNANNRSYTLNKEGIMLADFCKDVAPGIGVAVCGEFDDEEKFVYEYYYPYLEGTGVTSYEDVTIEKHAGKDSFAGVCDDIKVGISLIFALQDRISYVTAQTEDKLPVKGTSLTLAGLSTEGTIMIPIEKDEKQKEQIKENNSNRVNLLAAARKGDEDAIETLTLEDMDIYASISKRIMKEDLYSLVDTSLMPYGVECDHYSILGDIVAMRKVKNEMTGEEIYILTISCNELTFDVCINIMDLFGEPQVGRRFKGVIWLQGKVNFPPGF
ncbi:MAG: DUF3881 family protein [Acetatifactor sp.]|nr:DUF3881 family protein [Acetatifactor sp.]